MSVVTRFPALRSLDLLPSETVMVEAGEEGGADCGSGSCWKVTSHNRRVPEVPKSRFSVERFRPSLGTLVENTAEDLWSMDWLRDSPALQH